MDDNKNKYEAYEKEYIPYISKWGRITNLVGAAISFLPALLLLFVFKLDAPIGAVIAATVAQVSASFAYYVVDPIAFYPILGLAGTYMAFMTGNISNLRLPCAANALDAAGVKAGTKEATIISTLGIGSSVVVNLLMLTMGVFLGTKLISMLPSVVNDSLKFLIPAIFGAVFIQLSFTAPKIGAIALGISVIMTLVLKLGYLNFLPGYPSYVVALTAVFGTMFICKVLYKKGRLKEF
ncbi:MAG: hypothetical protein RSB70_01630 [Clostridium sp.]